MSFGGLMLGCCPTKNQTRKSSYFDTVKLPGIAASDIWFRFHLYIILYQFMSVPLVLLIMIVTGTHIRSEWMIRKHLNQDEFPHYITHVRDSDLGQVIMERRERKGQRKRNIIPVYMWCLPQINHKPHKQTSKQIIIIKDKQTNK